MNNIFKDMNLKDKYVYLMDMKNELEQEQDYLEKIKIYLIDIDPITRSTYEERVKQYQLKQRELRRKWAKLAKMVQQFSKELQKQTERSGIDVAS